MGYIPPRHQRVNRPTADDIANEIYRARLNYLHGSDFYAERLRANQNEKGSVWRFTNNFAAAFFLVTGFTTQAWLVVFLVTLLFYIPVLLMEGLSGLFPPDWRGFW
jgi:hypothetical protein